MCQILQCNGSLREIFWKIWVWWTTIILSLKRHTIRTDRSENISTFFFQNSQICNYPLLLMRKLNSPLLETCYTTCQTWFSVQFTQKWLDVVKKYHSFRQFGYKEPVLDVKNRLLFYYKEICGFKSKSQKFSLKTSF